MQNMTHCTDQQLLSNFGGESRARWHDGWNMLRTAFSQFMLQMALISQVQRERRELAKLDDQQLGDIGVDAATAAFESRRSYLDIPANRLNQGRQR